MDALNGCSSSRRGDCRDDAFFGDERAVLHPLLYAPFEWYERRRREVSPDHRVQADHMRYPPSHALVGRTLDVCLDVLTVAILESGEDVAEHRGLRS